MSLPADLDTVLSIACAPAGRIVEVRVPEAAQRAAVRVLRIDFVFDTPLDTPAFDVLSDDERARARRFLRAEDGVRSATTRTALRGLLGARLGIAPAEVRLVTDAAGRPGLAPDLAARVPGFDFNVSHSGRHALVAWSDTARVGVDIEGHRPGIGWASLGPAVFAADDGAWVEAHPEGAREAAFYRVWSAKEALLKALGTGIAGGLAAFSVVDPTYGARRPAVRVVEPASPARGVAGFEAGWLEAPDGYAACVAWPRA